MGGLLGPGVSASPRGATMTKASKTVTNNAVKKTSSFEAVSMQPTVRTGQFEGYDAFGCSSLAQMHY